MNFGQIIKTPCLNTPPAPTPVNPNCADPAFTIANPTACGANAMVLILKPGSAICCLLGSVQLVAVVVQNGIETDVTASTVFTTNSPDIAVVGASSGNVTGLVSGDAIITATYQNLTANCGITVIGQTDCCSAVPVASMVLVDDSKSMSQKFNAAYASKLNYALAAAAKLIAAVNTQKDIIGLMQFDDSLDTLLAAPSANIAATGALLSGIVQTQQLTGFNKALTDAITQLNGTAALEKIIVLISDGEDTSLNADDANTAITTVNTFKANGGIVICLGVRATGGGFLLLEALATGGFFINAYDTTADASMNFLLGLMGYICGGNCTPTGDTISATGQLDYCAFKNWNVIGGHVDLIGNGFLDLLPGNDLYVDLAGSTVPQGGQMVSKNSFNLKNGHAYRLSLKLAGNQRVNDSPNTVQMMIYGRGASLLANPAIAPMLAFNSSSPPISPPQPVYKYVYTYVNANGETAPSPSTSITPNKVFGSISVQTTANPSATGIRIYRTTGATPDSPYYFIAEIANTAPVYTDHMDLSDMLAALVAGTVDACDTAPSTNTTGAPIVFFNQSVSVNDYQQGFEPQSFNFTMPSDATVWVSFQQTAFPANAGAAGLLLDAISFDDTTDIVNLLMDDFSTENEKYTPPACGVGSIYYDGAYATGYNCYGNGCLNTPPPIQLQDPFPLPSIESAATTPKQYTSTKNVCVSCPSGATNSGNVTIIPAMTGYAVPSGVASASSEDSRIGFSPGYAYQAFNKTPPAGQSYGWSTEIDALTGWLQYQFPSDQIITGYAITAVSALNSPNTWEFQGSTDGSTWTTLDTQTGMTFSNLQRLVFLINNTTAYLYYRINITANNGDPYTVEIRYLEMFGTPPQQACSTATAASLISQADADAKATAAATSQAQALLNCVPFWAATESYTANCPLGQLGQPVTMSATYTSYISQSDAQAQALALAQAAATAALSCSGSNNTQPITINDLAPATPYPSVKVVTGLTGHVTKVTVAIKGLSHTAPGDIEMVLRAPTGETCILMQDCGGTFSVSNINLTFDDSAGSSLPNNSLIAAGTYKPTVFGAGQIDMAAPMTAHPYGTTLAAFNGIAPNGSWSLWVQDTIVVDSGMIFNGWDLTITSA